MTRHNETPARRRGQSTVCVDVCCAWARKWRCCESHKTEAEPVNVPTRTICRSIRQTTAAFALKSCSGSCFTWAGDTMQQQTHNMKNTDYVGSFPGGSCWRLSLMRWDERMGENVIKFKWMKHRKKVLLGSVVSVPRSWYLDRYGYWKTPQQTSKTSGKVLE